MHCPCLISWFLLIFKNIKRREFLYCSLKYEIIEEASKANFQVQSMPVFEASKIKP